MTELCRYNNLTIGMSGTRRFITPSIKSATEVGVQINDISPESVLKDALNTAAIEVARYRVRVGKGDVLGLQEARIVQGWIRAMTDLMKELREAEKADALKDMTNEELRAIAKRLIKEDEETIPVESRAAVVEDNDDDS